MKKTTINVSVLACDAELFAENYAEYIIADEEQWTGSVDFTLFAPIDVVAEIAKLHEEAIEIYHTSQCLYVVKTAAGGVVMDVFQTMDEARNAIYDYEDNDRYEGTYVAGTYKIDQLLTIIDNI